MFDLVRQCEVDSSLADFPYEHDVQLALLQVNGGKAARSSDILPEMLKISQTNSDFILMLTKFVKAAWKERHVPQDWRDVIVVPIPKNFNLHYCNYW